MNWLSRTGPECVKQGRNSKLCLVCSHFWSTHWVQRPHSTCAFLADVGQVVVAGHVVPLAILMGNGHHAVLASCEEVVRLALPPVLIYLQRRQTTGFSDAFAVICQKPSDGESPIFSKRMKTVTFRWICEIEDEILLSESQKKGRKWTALKVMERNVPNQFPHNEQQSALWIQNLLLKFAVNSNSSFILSFPHWFEALLEKRVMAQTSIVGKGKKRKKKIFRVCKTIDFQPVGRNSRGGRELISRCRQMVVKKINKSNDWGIGFILQCLYQGYNFLQIDFIECVCESVCVSDQDSHTNTHTNKLCGSGAGWSRTPTCFLWWVVTWKRFRTTELKSWKCSIIVKCFLISVASKSLKEGH